jgi:hypothetical protein
MTQWRKRLAPEENLPSSVRRRIVGLLSAFLMTQAFSGCALETLSSNRTKSDDDLQERLSSAISRNGFSHGLRSERVPGFHYDSIYIHIPLDSLKRRHYSLGNLMRDVGKVCSLPEYAEYPIRIEFAAGDFEDRSYLETLLLKEVGTKTNVVVTVHSDVFNDMLITVTHPVKSAR